MASKAPGTGEKPGDPGHTQGGDTKPGHEGHEPGQNNSDRNAGGPGSGGKDPHIGDGKPTP